jgi:putative SOS response-associated peptidase YedK
MCGRYRRSSSKQRIAEAFGISDGLDELDIGPADDIAPGSMQPVVSIDQDGHRRLELMRWGFKLPTSLLFNARSEGIETVKFWRDPFRKGRVLVPADAIFEWKQDTGGKKKPKYELTIPGQQPFAMAGLSKLWKNPKTGQWEPTFAILTGPPNQLMQSIHDRMTTFLNPRDYAEYLDPAERPPLHLLRILPTEELYATLLDCPKVATRQPGLFD